MMGCDLQGKQAHQCHSELIHSLIHRKENQLGVCVFTYMLQLYQRWRWVCLCLLNNSPSLS